MWTSWEQEFVLLISNNVSVLYHHWTHGFTWMEHLVNILLILDCHLFSFSIQRPLSSFTVFIVICLIMVSCLCSASPARFRLYLTSAAGSTVPDTTTHSAQRTTPHSPTLRFSCHFLFIELLVSTYSQSQPSRRLSLWNTDNKLKIAINILKY